CGQAKRRKYFRGKGHSRSAGRCPSKERFRQSSGDHSVSQSRQRFLVFDLDDTLVDTSDLYWRARRRFAEAFADRGIPQEEVIRRFEEIDTSHIETWGFVPERYEHSMRATYEVLIAENLIRPDPSLEAVVKTAGGMIAQENPQPIKGAI